MGLVVGAGLSVVPEVGLRLVAPESTRAEYGSNGLGDATGRHILNDCTHSGGTPGTYMCV